MDRKLKQNKNECEICGKVYQHSTNLFRHKKQHRERGLFACLKCKRNYSRLDSLRKHEQKGNCDKKKLDGWACATCSRVYQHKRSYTRHMKSHKERPTTDQQQKTMDGSSSEEELELITGKGEKLFQGKGSNHIPYFTDSEDEPVVKVPETPCKDETEYFIGGYELPVWEGSILLN